MLTWPKARKSNHPLADKEDAKELFAQLSCIDSLSALQRLSELLDGLKIARGIGLGRLYDIVDAADRTGRAHYRSASREFLGHRHRLTRYQGNRIWTSAGEYVTQLAEAYQWCLAQFLAGASGAADLRPHIVRIIGRAIRLQAAALKWDYFCYTSHFGKWAEIYRKPDQRLRDRHHVDGWLLPDVGDLLGERVHHPCIGVPRREAGRAGSDTLDQDQGVQVTDVDDLSRSDLEACDHRVVFGTQPLESAELGKAAVLLHQRLQLVGAGLDQRCVEGMRPIDLEALRSFERVARLQEGPDARDLRSQGRHGLAPLTRVPITALPIS